MSKPLQIQVKTLTPLWTGGITGTSDRVRETGIIGSLRWWYEAIVRGLDGHVGDPTAESKAQRSEFDGSAYREALRRGSSTQDALAEGLKRMGAVEYLFGTTGWARLFQLRVVRVPRTPLHFRTTLEINKNWLGRIFHGKEELGYAIDDLRACYGDTEFQLAFRGHDVSYAQVQLALLLRWVEAYGGLGAKLQHGFGQVGDLKLPSEIAQTTIESGLQALADKLDASDWRRKGPSVDTPYSLANFFHLAYALPASALHRFTQPDAHFGSPKKQAELNYLPCAFDLRYKGEGNLGLRRWLREEKGWAESDDPTQLGPLDRLMGPRSQWKDESGRFVSIQDDLRTASRVCFGMPVRIDNGYQLAVFGFAPPDILSVEDLIDLCEEYMRLVFDATPTTRTTGKEVIARARGGTA